MTIETHNVVADAPIAGEVAVIDEFPRGWVEGITEASQGLNLPYLRKQIERAASVLNSLAKSRGLDPSDLSEETTALMQEGIIARCVQKGLIKLAAFDQAREYGETWEEVKRVLREAPEETGDDHDEATSSPIASNVDLNSTPKLDYGKDKQVW